LSLSWACRALPSHSWKIHVIITVTIIIVYYTHLPSNFRLFDHLNNI
jgi:hypothetical protein